MTPLLPLQSGGMAAALQMNHVRHAWLRDRTGSGPGYRAERQSENEVEVHSVVAKPIKTNAAAPQGDPGSSKSDARGKKPGRSR